MTIVVPLLTVMLMRRSGVVALLMLAALLVAPSPAAAAPPALQVADTPLAPSGQCTMPPYSYQANPPPGYPNVDVTIDVYSPSGTYLSSIYRTGATGSGNITLCNNPVQGQYRATIDTFACTSDYSSCQSIAGPADYFYVGPPPPPLGPVRTKTVLKVKPGTATTPDQLIKFKITRLFDYGDGALEPSTGKVHLEQRIDGVWERVPGSKRTADDGRVTLRYRVPGTVLKVRAKSFGPSSYSKVITLT